MKRQLEWKNECEHLEKQIKWRWMTFPIQIRAQSWNNLRILFSYRHIFYHCCRLLILKSSQDDLRLLNLFQRNGWLLSLLCGGIPVNMNSLKRFIVPGMGRPPEVQGWEIHLFGLTKSLGFTIWSQPQNGSQGSGAKCWKGQLPCSAVPHAAFTGMFISTSENSHRRPNTKPGSQHQLAATMAVALTVSLFSYCRGQNSGT